MLGNNDASAQTPAALGRHLNRTLCRAGQVRVPKLTLQGLSSTGVHSQNPHWLPPLLQVASWPQLPYQDAELAMAMIG